MTTSFIGAHAIDKRYPAGWLDHLDRLVAELASWLGENRTENISMLTISDEVQGLLDQYPNADWTFYETQLRRILNLLREMLPSEECARLFSIAFSAPTPEEVNTHTDSGKCLTLRVCKSLLPRCVLQELIQRGWYEDEDGNLRRNRP